MSSSDQPRPAGSAAAVASGPPLEGAPREKPLREEPPREGAGGRDGALRVLVVTNLWPLGGSFQGIFVAEQVDALRRLGHHVDVEVVARGSSGWRNRLDYLTAGPRVRRRARQGGYDVVHVHYGLTALAGCFAAGVPRVLSLHGSDVNTRWQRWCSRLCRRGYRARIYVSRRLAEVAGDPAGVVIPAGVDFELFAPASVDRDAARAGLGIAPDEKAVLFGGAPANAVKGYDVFRDVLAAVDAGGELAVRELILAEPGQPREAVVAKMAAADALLFTSRKGAEGSPMVVKEAAAMGLPVVSVDVGDVAEVLAGVTPAAVVAFPQPWGGAPARAELVDTLAARLAEVLAKPGPEGLTGSGRVGMVQAGPVRLGSEPVGAVQSGRVGPAEPGPVGYGRSDGRDRVARLDATRVAGRVVDVYRQVRGTVPQGAGQLSGPVHQGRS